MVNFLNGILHNNEKEPTIAVCNKDESHRHTLKQKEAVLKSAHYMIPFIWSLKAGKILYSDESLKIVNFAEGIMNVRGHVGVSDVVLMFQLM